MKKLDAIHQKTNRQVSLKIAGATVIALCHSEHFEKGELYYTRHMLVFILSGKYRVGFGKEIYVLRKNEGLFIMRAHYVEYERLEIWDINITSESLIFLFDDQLIKDFRSIHPIKGSKKIAQMPIIKIPCNPQIDIFLQSVVTAFGNGLSKKDTFLKNKLVELLFNLCEVNPDFIFSLRQFAVQSVIDINKVMESNFRSTYSLTEFALKSGRSLASFKRDFQKIYNMSPHQWLLGKRLEYAKKLILAGNYKISEICVESGFGNPANFSRAFKRAYGVSPSSLKAFSGYNRNST